MDVLHLGADGNAVQAGKFLAQQAALQAGVDGQHLRLLAIHIGIGAHHGIPQVGLLSELPGGIFTHLAISALIELRQLSELIKQLLLLAVDRAPNGERNRKPFSQFRNAHIEAGLHQAGNISAHGLNTIGSRAEQADHLGGGLGGQAVSAQCVHVKGLNGGLRLVVLFPDLRLKLLSNGVNPLQVDTHSHQSCLAGTGDSVVLGATGERGQAERHQLLDAAHKFAHDLVGIGTVLVNLRAGVSALKTVYSQTDAGAVDRTALSIEGNGSRGTACAGHGKDTFLLAVQVDKGAATKHGQVNSIRAQHADLLVHGDDNFQRRVRNGLVRQERHGIGYSDAVVTAQSGASSEHITLIVGHIQPILSHVQRTVGILFTDHIHMALEDYRGMILQAAGALLKEDHIVGFVLNIADSIFLGEGNQIIRDPLGIPGTVGNGTDFFKIAENGSRLKARKLNGFHSKTLLAHSMN